MRRNIDGQDKIDYAFDKNFVLRPGAKTKVNLFLFNVSH